MIAAVLPDLPAGDACPACVDATLPFFLDWRASADTDPDFAPLAAGAGFAGGTAGRAGAGVDFAVFDAAEVPRSTLVLPGAW